MFNYLLYAFAAGALTLSTIKSPQKTKAALKRAWKTFENILPQILSIFLIVGIMLAIVNKETIVHLLGAQSGLLGMLLAALIGSVSLIQGFVAFPLAASVLSAGAGYAQIAVFISTLMMVGIVTLPVEIRFFGRKAAYLRNGMALIFSFLVALVIGGILG